VLATLLSATLHGLAGRVVRVEVDVAPGLPGFTIVGLPDAALSEARERVRGALRNAGYRHPPRRITVNLAPAELRKAGASLDLAIAMGVLLGSEQVAADMAGVGLVGELGLGGEVRRVPGLLPMTLALRDRGVRRVLVPEEALAEARLAPGVEVIGVGSLGEAAACLRRPRSRRRAPEPLPRTGVGPGASPRGAAEGAAVGLDRVPDLAEVRGQVAARRGLEIALAGGHALLLIGPPGAGKTLLARTIPSLLPDLDDTAALAATVVASVASEAPVTELQRRPPVRMPHHTVSYAGMVGGGPRLAPGEVTLADQGCLVCDELPEFGRDVLEALRQPLEEGSVAVVRVGRWASFPARFTFVAAMNPCPCGFRLQQESGIQRPPWRSSADRRPAGSCGRRSGPAARRSPGAARRSTRRRGGREAWSGGQGAPRARPSRHGPPGRPRGPPARPARPRSGLALPRARRPSSDPGR
jgi:magnesium chelatase family protein